MGFHLINRSSILRSGTILYALVVELVDTTDLKSVQLWVRLPPWVPHICSDGEIGKHTTLRE